jgi:hypothetical protein
MFWINKKKINKTLVITGKILYNKSFKHLLHAKLTKKIIITF